jgi:hypothetical protein
MAGRIVYELSKTWSHMEIAYAFTHVACVRLKFFHDLGSPGRITNRSACNHAYAITGDIAHNRITLPAEPVLDSRIQYLICNRIPTMRKHNLADKRKIVRAGESHVNPLCHLPIAPDFISSRKAAKGLNENIRQ